MARMQFDRALRHADEVLEADPLNDSAALTRISALRSQGRVEDARKELETLKRRAGSTLTLNVESGLLAVVEGKPDKAELIFKESFRPGMDNVRVVLGYAEALTAQGKNGDAVRILEDDLALMPRRPAVRFALAETLTRTGDSQRAIAEFRRILEDDPRVDVVYERLSALYVKRSQLPAALELLKRGKTLLPNSVAIASSLAQVFELSGAAAEAKTAYEQWIALERSNPTPKNNLAYLLAQEGKDLERAYELVSAALRIAPKMPEYRDTLGFIYLRQGAKESARKIFEKLVADHPKEPVFRSHYALAAGSQ
jgi:tetratricopeptide (TPR) repeat protein